MKTIGYREAKRLMKLHDWKMRITACNFEVERIEIYHPLEKTVYNLRRDSGKKLLWECRVVGHGEYDQIAILCYDHPNSNEDLI